MRVGKKLLSVVMSLVLVVGLMPVPAMAASGGNEDGGDGGVGLTALGTSVSTLSITPQATGSVTRAEWLSKLVETFDITVEDEDEYPEDYFSDLESTNSHYLDVLKAVDFGIVDVAAGDPVNPDELATREFAAQTLNFCLGFQLDEGAEYTYSDTGDTEYDDDLQVAVNRNWFSLSGGKVLPSQAITSAESSAMIADASEVWHSTDGLDSVANNVKLASDVKVVPRGTQVALSEDGATVSITECPVAISAGDKFAVYFDDDLPVAYKAALVSKKGNVTAITVSTVDPSEVYDSLVYGEEEEIDLNDFQEEDGVSTQMHANVNAAAASGVNTGGFTVQGLKAQGISYKNGTLSLWKDFGPGKVTGAIAGMKVEKSADLVRNKYHVAVSGTLSLTASVKGSVDLTLPIGAVWCAGCTSSFNVVAKAEGSVSKTVSANFKVGVEYDPYNGWRMIKNFKKGKPGVTATANSRIGFDTNMTVGAPGISATLGADFGFEANYIYDRYSSGTPKVCQDIEGHLYAGAYASATIGAGKLKKPFRERFDVWSANNSPVRLHRHIEDGKDVASCSRGKRYTYRYWRTGSGGSRWGYLMNGTAGSGSGWGYNDAGEWVEYATYEYELDGQKATITKYHGNTRALVVPETIDGYTVVGIGDGSFSDNAFLTTVQLPDNITTIGTSAFANCPLLTTVDLPLSLAVLGGAAFDNDSQLSSITIPASLREVKTIYGDASLMRHSVEGYTLPDIGPFVGCTGLKSVSFESGLRDIPANLFAYCSGIEELSIPDGVISIGENAFSNCWNLRHVDMASTVTSIGYRSFIDCESLSSVKLSSSLKSIGSWAFAFDGSLESLEVPATLESCGASFGYRYGTGGLSSLHTDITGGPFVDCVSLGEITFAKGCECVPANIFLYCTGIEHLVIPEGVTVIGDGAFGHCENLVDVSFPRSSLDQVGDSAFEACGKVKKLAFPDSVSGMGDRVCKDCESLEEAHLPDKRVNLMTGTFEGCVNLTTVNIPDTVECIWDDAFMDCRSLKITTVPAKVTTIGKEAFGNCKSIESFTVPSSVEKISPYAFAGCNSLEKLTMSNSVKYLGQGAFLYCSSLKDVTLSTEIDCIPESAFENCDALESFVIPYRVTEIEDNAFAECVNLSSVTIPRATTSIADNAFSYPAKMTIYGVAGTAAETYANGKSIKFVAQNIPATSIKLSKSSVVMLNGDGLDLVADIQPMNFTDEVTWKSANKDIVEVDQSGHIEAVGTGSTTVKLVVGDQAASVKVTVLQPVTSVSVSPYSLSLEGGQTSQLTASVYPSDAYDKSLEWSSSDASVVTVDQNGKVTALKKGTARITATAKDGSGRYDTCDVTVTCNVTKAAAVSQLESPHPYEKNCTDVWQYTLAGASALDVKFDSRTVTEDGADYIRIYTGGNVLVASYTGKQLAGTTVRVSGDTVRIKLESDEALNDWGFKVDSVTAAGASTTEPSTPTTNPMTSTTSTANTASPTTDTSSNNSTNPVAISATKVGISGATVGAIPARTYTGKSIEPRPSVKFGSKTLRLNVDYSLSYSNNVNAGTATVTVRGKGAYTGSVSKTFKISKAANTLKVSGKTATAKYSKKKATAVKAAKAYKFAKKGKGALSYKRVAAGSSKWLAKVNAKTGAVTVKKGAPKGKTYKVKVKVTAKGNANYKAASKTVTVKVKVK